MSANDDLIIDHVDDENSGEPARHHGAFLHGRALRFKRKSSVALVTTASVSPEENLRKREIQYNWLQGSRIPLLIASAVTYWWMESIWLSLVLFLISVPMPWIAVVIGNLHGEARDPRAPVVYKPQVIRDYNAHQLDASKQIQLTAGASEHAEESYGQPNSGETPTGEEEDNVQYKNSGGMFS